MNTFLTLLLVLNILLVIYGLIQTDKLLYKNKKYYTRVIYASTAIAVNCVWCLININTPKAIDVYNNRTTMKYIVIDNNKIDSFVVFKKNYND